LLGIVDGNGRPLVSSYNYIGLQD